MLPTQRATGRGRERGQLTAVFALALTAIVMMVGLVVDGGYAWTQRRGAQNAADLAAIAATRVVATRTATNAATLDATVKAAIDRTVANNGGAPVSYGSGANGPRYVNGRGQPLAGLRAWVGNGFVPAAARGVRLSSTRSWDPFFLRIAGISNWSASAEATATTDATPGFSSGPLMPLAVKWPVELPPKDTAEKAVGNDDGGLRLCVDLDLDGRDDITDKPCKPRDHGFQPGWEICSPERALDECDNSVIRLGNDDNGGQFGWMSWAGHLSTPELCGMIAPDTTPPTLEVPIDGSIQVQAEPGKHNAPCVSEMIEEWAAMGTTIYVPVVSPGPGPCPTFCYPGTLTPYPPTLDGNGSNAKYNVIGFAGFQFLGCGNPCIDDVRGVFRGTFNLGPTGQAIAPQDTQFPVRLVR